jgi:hypothetical protein
VVQPSGFKFACPGIFDAAGRGWLHQTSPAQERQVKASAEKTNSPAGFGRRRAV